jgi:hypothetical protein
MTDSLRDYAIRDSAFGRLTYPRPVFGLDPFEPIFSRAPQPSSALFSPGPLTPATSTPATPKESTVTTEATTADYNYKHTDADGDELLIETEHDEKDEQVASVNTTGSSIVYVSKDAAPAAALAILKAAGYVADAHGDRVGHAVANLEKAIEKVEAAKAEAADRVNLEAEALRLHNARRTAHPLGIFLAVRSRFEDLTPQDQAAALGIARESRKIAAEKAEASS